MRLLAENRESQFKNETPEVGDSFRAAFVILRQRR
jgi:hypothetical protein